MLLKNGADVNLQGGPYGSALIAASIKLNPAIIQLLLDHSADINAQGEKMCTALQVASSSGNEEVVRYFLDKGVDINAQGRNGTALQAAFYSGYEAVVRYLLDKGADVNAQRGLFGNALTAASTREESLAIVQLLLERHRRQCSSWSPCKCFGSGCVAL